MRNVLIGSSLFLLSCMSPNPEPRHSVFHEGTWIKLKSETFDGQGNLIGSSIETEKTCNSYLKVSAVSMESLEPITATGEAALQFSRCYTRKSFPYAKVSEGGFKSRNDSILTEDGKLVFVRRYFTLSGREELETSKVYYGKIREYEMDLSKCGCFQ